MGDMTDGIPEMLMFFLVICCAAFVGLYVVLRATGAHPLTALAKGLGL